MSCSVCTYVKKVLYGEAVILDEAVNVLIPSVDSGDSFDQNAHSTISMRLAKMKNNGSKIGLIGCKILTLIQNKIFRISGDHCTDALEGFPDVLPTNG